MEDHNRRSSSQSQDAQLAPDGEEVGDLAPGTSRRVRSGAPVIGVAGAPVVFAVVTIAGNGHGSSAGVVGQTVLPPRTVRLRHRKLPGVSRAVGIRPGPRTVERGAARASCSSWVAYVSYAIDRHAVLLGRTGFAPIYRLGRSSLLANSTISYGMPCKPEAFTTSGRRPPAFTLPMVPSPTHNI
jgi:hypothetical protein